MSIDYYGDAFRWFVGIVENNSSDPLKLGRVQVRIRGVHSENPGDIPLRDLPWAQPMLPSTEPAATILPTPCWFLQTTVVGCPLRTGLEGANVANSCV